MFHDGVVLEFPLYSICDAVVIGMRLHHSAAVNRLLFSKPGFRVLHELLMTEIVGFEMEAYALGLLAKANLDHSSQHLSCRLLCFFESLLSSIAVYFTLFH